MDVKPRLKLKAKINPNRDKSHEQSFSLDYIKALAEIPEGEFYRPRKQQISIRLDADVLAWFKAQPYEKYQKLINKACRLFKRLHEV